MYKIVYILPATGLATLILDYIMVDKDIIF